MNVTRILRFVKMVEPVPTSKALLCVCALTAGPARLAKRMSMIVSITPAIMVAHVLIWLDTTTAVVHMAKQVNKNNAYSS